LAASILSGSCGKAELPRLRDAAIQMAVGKAADAIRWDRSMILNLFASLLIAPSVAASPVPSAPAAHLGTPTIFRGRHTDRPAPSSETSGQVQCSPRAPTIFSGRNRKGVCVPIAYEDRAPRRRPSIFGGGPPRPAQQQAAYAPAYAPAQGTYAPDQTGYAQPQGTYTAQQPAAEQPKPKRRRPSIFTGGRRRTNESGN
jgi:hypothetical protein